MAGLGNKFRLEHSHAGQLCDITKLNGTIADPEIPGVADETHGSEDGTPIDCTGYNEIAIVVQPGSGNFTSWKLQILESDEDDGTYTLVPNAVSAEIGTNATPYVAFLNRSRINKPWIMARVIMTGSLTDQMDISSAWLLGAPDLSNVITAAQELFVL